MKTLHKLIEEFVYELDYDPDASIRHKCMILELEQEIWEWHLKLKIGGKK